MYDISGLIANLLIFIFAVWDLLVFTTLDEGPVFNVDTSRLSDWVVNRSLISSRFLLRQDDLMVEK